MEKTAGYGRQPAGAGSARRLEPGNDGVWSDAVHAARAAVPAVSSGRPLPGEKARLGGAPSGKKEEARNSRRHTRRRDFSGSARRNSASPSSRGVKRRQSRRRGDAGFAAVALSERGCFGQRPTESATQSCARQRRSENGEAFANGCSSSRAAHGHVPQDRGIGVSDPSRKAAEDSRNKAYSTVGRDFPGDLESHAEDRASRPPPRKFVSPAHERQGVILWPGRRANSG